MRKRVEHELFQFWTRKKSQSFNEKEPRPKRFGILSETAYVFFIKVMHRGTGINLFLKSSVIPSRLGEVLCPILPVP